MCPHTHSRCRRRADCLTRNTHHAARVLAVRALVTATMVAATAVVGQLVGAPRRHTIRPPALRVRPVRARRASTSVPSLREEREPSRSYCSWRGRVRVRMLGVERDVHKCRLSPVLGHRRRRRPTSPTNRARALMSLLRRRRSWPIVLRCHRCRPHRPSDSRTRFPTALRRS